MNYIIFTYSKDKNVAKEAIRSIRRVDSESKIAVIDDANSPIGEFPEADYYAQSSFERHGNLNGIASIKGQLQTMIDVCNHFKADQLCKIDADTILLKQPPTNYTYWGAEIHPYSYLVGSGICYVMTLDAINKSLDFINSREWALLEYPEDRFISTINLTNQGHIDSYSLNRFMNLNGSDFSNNQIMDFDSKENSIAIHFGCVYGKNINRDTIAEYMKKFNDLKELK